VIGRYLLVTPDSFTCVEKSQPCVKKERNILGQHVGSSPPEDTLGKKETLAYAQTTLWEVVGDGCSKERLLLFLQLGTAGGLMMYAASSTHPANMKVLKAIQNLLFEFCHSMCCFLESDIFCRLQGSRW